MDALHIDAHIQLHQRQQFLVPDYALFSQLPLNRLLTATPINSLPDQFLKYISSVLFLYKL